MTSKVFIALRVPADPMFPLEVTLARAGDWWRGALYGLRGRVTRA